MRCGLPLRWDDRGFSTRGGIIPELRKKRRRSSVSVYELAVKVGYMESGRKREQMHAIV